MSRIDEIQERLDDAPERPWRAERADLELFVISEDLMLEANLGYVGNRPEKAARFIANAPDDIEFLIAEVARYKAATEAVKAMAAEWDHKTVEGARGFQSDVDAVLSEHLGESTTE